MRQALASLIIIGLAGAALFFEAFTFWESSATLAAIILLTTSYSMKYLSGSLGMELAYWGLTYAAFATVLLGVGLLQSHAGCQSLLGDCYRPSLPSGLRELKTALVVALHVANVLAVVASIVNLYQMFSKRS